MFWKLAASSVLFCVLFSWLIFCSLRCSQLRWDRVLFPFSLFLFLTGKEKVRRWDKYVKTFSSDKLSKIEDGRELVNWRLRYSELAVSCHRLLLYCCFIFWCNPLAEFFNSQFSVIIFGGAFEKQGWFQTSTGVLWYYFALLKRFSVMWYVNLGWGQRTYQSVNMVFIQ